MNQVLFELGSSDEPTDRVIFDTWLIVDTLFPF